MQKESASCNIVITGASRGIGAATALAFAREGHQVLALARSEEKLQALRDDSRGLPGTIYHQAVDIRDFTLSYLPGHWKQVDILIHNAAYLVVKPLTEISEEDWQQTYQTNVWAPLRMTQLLLPRLASGAHVIGIGSMGGVAGSEKFSGLSLYSSSKAALAILLECLQAEFADTDITFNTLALGAVETEMLRTAFPGTRPKVQAEAMGRYIAHFALEAPAVMRGQTTSLRRSNP